MAYSSYGRTDGTVLSLNAYTDSRGTFNLKAEEIGAAVKCILTTEHPEYSGIEKEIIINWTGTSYDAESRTFYVNDCDFHLERNSGSSTNVRVIFAHLTDTLYPIE